MHAYLISFPLQGRDLHMTLFKAFERLGVKDFLPSNPSKKSVIFHTNGRFIIARVKSPLEGAISVSKETLNATQGSTISGLVTLSRDQSKMFSPEQQKEFIAKHGRLPKSSENHFNIRMTNEQVKDYITSLFERSGMSLIDFKISDSPLAYQMMSKRKKVFKTMDISFHATITDIAAFEHAWLNGIGQLKTYGFGMLRVGVI